MSNETLKATNQKLHAELDALFIDMMEHITTVSFTAAYGVWKNLIRRVKGHMAYEEDHLLPLFSSLELDTQGGLAAGKTGALVHGDHIILLRTEENIEGLFKRLLDPDPHAAIAQSPRRFMIENLDIFMRWMRVMEHHTDRESTIFYDVFDAHLTDGEIGEHQEMLTAASA